MKKLMTSMFGLSLLVLLCLRGDARTGVVDYTALQTLAHCGECDKDDDSGTDEDSVIRLLVDCGKDHGEEDGDDEDSVIRALAHCGECGKKDDSGDDEDSLV